jgi:hypothetical protein
MGEPMLTAEERMELGVLGKHGAGIRELARVTGWSRNTVRRYFDAAVVGKTAPKRAERLDRVKAAAPDRIPAVVLFREIKARGYDGGETQLKQFVRGLVPAPALAPVCALRPSLVSRCRRTGPASGVAPKSQGIYRDVGLEPTGICRVPRRRARRDANPGS